MFWLGLVSSCSGLIDYSVNSGKTRLELRSLVPNLSLASFITYTARRKVAETKDEAIDDDMLCVAGRTSLILCKPVFK